MGKTSKKKKLKHQDFAKVKLKVGKKLPKAANQTDASFQSRSIQLKEQFKHGTGDPTEPSTKRKLVLSELLNHCQHSSSKMRHDAVIGLKELLVANPRLVKQHLCIILEKIAELFVDAEHAIRTTVRNLLKSILPGVSSTEISPFFGILSAYLCCAMTHIHEDVLSDSLQILDVLLDEYPEHVVSNSSKLLPNFLNQISSQPGGVGAGRKGEVGRSLLVNPSGKQGSHRWRVGVLERLQKFLKAVLVMKLRRGDQKDGEVPELLWTDGTSHQLVVNYGCPVSASFSLRSDSGIEKDESSLLAGENSLQGYMQTLVPLLLQCWVEVGPAQLTSQLPGNVLGTDALSVLASVLGVLDLLLIFTESSFQADDHAIHISWVREEYLKQFTHYFMVNFPYAMHENIRDKSWTGKKGKKEKKTIPVSIFAINLAVSKLMAYMIDHSDNACLKEDWFQDIVEYITEQLGGNKMSSEELKTCLDILKKILKVRLHDDTCSNILRVVLRVYRRKHRNSVDLQRLLHFFRELFQEKATYYKQFPVYSEWIQTLPVLLQQVSRDDQVTLTIILSIMKSANIQGDQQFQEQLSQHLCSVLDYSFVSKLGMTQQKHLVEIIFTVKHLNKDHFRCLAMLLVNDGLHVEMQLYLLKSLTQRVVRSVKADPPFDLGHYLSFLFTALFGRTREDLTLVTAPVEAALRASYFSIVSAEETAETWTRHIIRLQCVIDQLHELPMSYSSTLSTLWIHFLTSVLEKQQVLPLSCVVSLLLTTGSTAQSPACNPITDDNLATIAHLILDAMVTSVSAMTTDGVAMETDQAHLSIEQKVAVDQSCVLSLSSVAGLWDKVLGTIRQRIKYMAPEDAVLYLRLLETMAGADELLPLVKHSSKKLKDLLQKLVKLCPDVESSHQLAAIMYRLSVVEHTSVT